MGRQKKLPDGIRRRSGAYYADFCAAGRRVRKRLSSNLTVATGLLHELQARADRADFGILDNDYPLAELKDEFLRHCRQTLRSSTASRYAACLDNVLPRLSATRVTQINLDNVRAYRDERTASGATPRTINMEVTVLVTMLRWAVKEKKIGANPIAEFKPLPNDHPKEGRALTDTEVKALLDASTPDLRDVWYCFLVTGLRKSELTGLTFRDVDWTSREVIVRSGNAKNHRERRIPIDNGLWDILCRQEQGRKDRRPGAAQNPELTEACQERFSRDHVFVSKVNTPLDHRSNLYSAFLRCCNRAGIVTHVRDPEGRLVEHVDIHSLRRTFATNLIVAGADPETVRQLLGHKTLEMTMKIYTKIRNQTKRQALAKLTYGQGTLAPDHVVEYPGTVGLSVQESHKVVTREKSKKAN